MRLPSCEFGSTRSQYMRVTVVPAKMRHSPDKSVSESVDKPVEFEFDSERLEKRSPGGRKTPARTPARRGDSHARRNRCGTIGRLELRRRKSALPKQRRENPSGRSLFLQTMSRKR